MSVYFVEKVINEQSYVILPVREVIRLSSLMIRLRCEDSYLKLNMPHYSELVRWSLLMFQDKDPRQKPDTLVLNVLVYCTNIIEKNREPHQSYIIHNHAISFNNYPMNVVTQVRLVVT